jgi:curved DNA-binding protein CbpA
MLINCYEVLSLPPDTTDVKRIRTRYLRLAKKYHPDKNPVSDEEEKVEIQEKFIAIQLAYEILSDPEAKRLYDMTNNTDEQYTKSNFAKFSNAYKEAVNEINIKATHLRDEAKQRRKQWEKELQNDKIIYEKQKQEFKKWKKHIIKYLEMLMAKVSQMEDCQAKADILFNVQNKMNEMKMHVDNLLQKRLTTGGRNDSNSQATINNNDGHNSKVLVVTDYEKQNYNKDLEKFNLMKSKYEKLIKIKSTAVTWHK